MGMNLSKPMYTEAKQTKPLASEAEKDLLQGQARRIGGSCSKTPNSLVVLKQETISVERLWGQSQYDQLKNQLNSLILFRAFMWAVSPAWTPPHSYHLSTCSISMRKFLGNNISCILGQTPWYILTLLYIHILCFFLFLFSRLLFLLQVCVWEPFSSPIPLTL